MTDKVRLASVGLGNWAGVLARAVARGSVAEIVSCWSRSAESIAHFQQEHGVSRSAGSLEELLADPEIEGILVTTPNDAHMPAVVSALEAGKAVYTDKPIAHSLSDAVKIKDAVERTGGVFSVGHSARRISGHRVMKDWVASGRTGGISMVEAHFTTRTGFNLTPDSWRYSAADNPGGPLIQLGVHHCDTLQYLMGPVVSVSAKLRKLFVSADVPDTVMSLLEFDSGALGVLADGWASPATYQMRIFGTEANLFFDVNVGSWQHSEILDTGSRLEVQRRGEAERTRIELRPTDMFREQIEEFAQAARGEAVVEISIDDSLRALAVVLAAVQSSERGGIPVSPSDLIKEAVAG